jgi:zinc transport system permease protein
MLEDLIALFGNSILGSAVVGAVCPLVGAFLVLRRSTFLGLALPQFSTAGLAFGFLSLPLWEWLFDHRFGHDEFHLASEGSSMGYHLFWALLFTVGGLLFFVTSGRKGRGTPEGRTAAGYIVASAATILFIQHSAFGEAHIMSLMRGEILAISASDLYTILAIFGGVLAVFALYHRDFLISAFDREAAAAMGKNVFAWDLLFFLLVALSISVGVMTVGPLVIFSLLVLPPLAARFVAWNMTSFYIVSSVIGLATVLAGFAVSYTLDWPTGPTDIALAFALLIVLAAVRKIRGKARRGTVARRRVPWNSVDQ